MMNTLEVVKHLIANTLAIKFIVLCLGILVISILVRLAKRSLSHSIQNDDVRYRLCKVVTLTGYLIIIVFITIVFSDVLGKLTVFFGVVAAGVAFALQEVIASFAGWIAISLGDFYNPGDRVQLGGIMGNVIDVGILRTTLMECGDWVKADQYNGRIVRIANSFVFKEPVYNYSGDFPFVWDEIRIPVKYGSDRVLAKHILQETVDRVVGEYITAAKIAWRKMLRKYLIEDVRIEPTVTLIATDNWLEFTVRYIVDYKRRRGVKDELFTELLDKIEQTQGRVSIASATFQLVQAPPLEVKIMHETEQS